MDKDKEKFDEGVKEVQLKLGPDYSQKEYTFTIEEKRRLAQMEAIKLFSRQAADDVLNLSVLPRVKVNPGEAKVFYDVSLGRFVVFSPKKDK